MQLGPGVAFTMTASTGPDRASVMDQLKRRLDILVDPIPPDAPIIYFDVPVHLNVGDLMILAGTEALLAHHGRRVSHRFSVRDYSRFLEAVTDRHVLVCHGGGNLGNVWPAHEALRQDILRRFPRNRFVILPQTAHFHDTASAAVLGEAYRVHPDCTLFVRDERSRDLVQRHMGVPCTLAPDMAHFLWRQEHNFRAGEGELLMRRTDREAADSAAVCPGIDWRDLLMPGDSLMFRALARAMTLNASATVQPLLMKAWRLHAGRLVAHAEACFDRCAAIRSDRLHAVILGCLLGKGAAMIDNSYGKLSSYFDTWMPGMVPLER